jgi:hypothetical protein
VKIPHFVAAAWANAKQDEVLGSMMVGIKPGREATKQMIIKLDPDREGSADIPNQFTLDEVKTSGMSDGDTMLAFNIDNDTKQLSIEGTVTKSMVLKPSRTAEYQNLVRQRGLSKIANRREVAVVEARDVEEAAKQSCTIEFLSSVRGEMKKKGGGKATGELDLGALKSKFFEAFELDKRQSFDTILTMCSQVPGFSREQDLRDLLEKYANYHHKGPFRGLWELKSTFRDHQEQSENDVANSKQQK